MADLVVRANDDESLSTRVELNVGNRGGVERASLLVLVLLFGPVRFS